MSQVFIPTTTGYITEEELNAKLRKYSTVGYTNTKISKSGDTFTNSSFEI